LSNKSSKSRTKRYNIKYVLIFWSVVIGFASLFCGILVATSLGWLGPLPTFDELENPKPILASEVYSSDSVLLGKYYYAENRSITHYNELSPNLINALIATEDIRFLEHSGIDTRGLLRVAFKTVILGMNAGGGSTITQQLAKNLFHERPKSKYERVKQKLKEWIIAARLEKTFTKEEIIQNYLNTVAFSGHSFGVKSAAQEFFNTTTDSLKIEEAAVLIGMLKATGDFNPIRHPDNSIVRRNIVIGQMAKYGFIEHEVADSLIELPITINYHSVAHDEGIARYFREHLRLELRKWCKENNYNLYADGLKIYTTIDSRMQKYAEESVKEHLTGLQKDFFKHWEKRGDPWGKETKFLKQAMVQSKRYRNLKSRGFSEDSIMAIFAIPDTMRVFSWRGEIDTIMSPWDFIKVL